VFYDDAEKKYTSKGYMTTNKDYADNIDDEHIQYLNNRINIKDKN
jgi:hypothetical protein